MYITARVLGAVLRSNPLNRDELASTIEGLADTDGPATGSISLSTWVTKHGDTLSLHRVR